MSAMDPDELDFKDPPIFVYADYEVMQSADGEHQPIMRNQSGEPYTCILRRTLFSGLSRISKSIGYQ